MMGTGWNSSWALIEKESVCLNVSESKIYTVTIDTIIYRIIYSTVYTNTDFAVNFSQS